MAATEYAGMPVPSVTPKEIYAASIVLPVLGIVFVLLRFYARTLKKNSIGFDDWLMLPALILVIGMGICLLIGVHTKAVAYHIPPVENLEQFTNGIPKAQLLGKIGYAYQILTILEFGIIKLSFTLYYRRIFVISEGFLFDWITKAAIAIVVIWTAAFLFAYIFACGSHIFANWGSPQVVSRYCGVKTYPIGGSFVVSDLITDVLVLCLPLPTVSTRSTKRFTKNRIAKVIGLDPSNVDQKKTLGIFATGAVSTVAAIIKVIITFELINGVSKHIDLYLASSTVLYWTMIEGGLAVIAACLPTLRLVVGTVSLSSILHRLRSALGGTSVHSQNQELQQISRRFPSRSEELYTQIDADSSTSSTFGAARETNKNPINNLITGSANGFSEPKSHGIQSTGQFSQQTSF